jgi:transcriptional regulator with XRE-family HTH domain
MDSHVTSAQIRAARGLLNWSVRELSEQSGIHRNTITNFETGKSGGDALTIDALLRTLKSAGVIFVAENGEGPGVRLRKKRPR